jgi:hypothetical protein
VDRQTAILIVAEIGVDTSQWSTDKHLTARAGLAPGNRLARRRGAERVAMAVARTILQIADHLIAKAECYRDLGADYWERRNTDTRAGYLKRELEKLEFKVTLEPTAA